MREIHPISASWITRRWRCSHGRVACEMLRVELYLKAGRTPFDVSSVYLKTGKRFRVVLKYRTDLYLKTGQNCT